MATTPRVMSEERLGSGMKWASEKTLVPVVLACVGVLAVLGCVSVLVVFGLPECTSSS